VVAYQGGFNTPGGASPLNPITSQLMNAENTTNSWIMVRKNGNKQRNKQMEKCEIEIVILLGRPGVGTRLTGADVEFLIPFSWLYYILISHHLL
jgi:hypothetical protein